MSQLLECLDHTQIQAFRTCPTKYRFAYREGYQKQEKELEEQDRYFGQAIHEALETYYLGVKDGKDTRALALTRFSGSYSQQLDETDLAKTQENGIKALEQYFKWAQVNDSMLEILSVEETKAFYPVKEIGYTVKLDLVVRRKDTKEIYGVDHKTTKKSLADSSFWRRFDPDHKITGYCAYLEEAYGSCAGMYVSAISFRYRKKTYKGQPAGFYSDFQRNIFNRSPAQVQNWRKDLGYWVEKMEEAEKLHFWAKNTESCRFCPYTPICIAEWVPEEDEDSILCQFKKVENPREYLKEGLS